MTANLMPTRDPGGSMAGKPGLGAGRFKRLSWFVPALALGVFFSLFLAGCGDTGDNSEDSGQKDDSQVAARLANLQESGALAGAQGAANTITVVGKATITSAPDEAVLTITVENEAATPAGSLDANSKATEKVMARLAAEGVDKSAVQTENVSVYPVRTYDPKTGKENLTGYRSQNTVTVTLKDVLVVGKVLAASVETGAGVVSGPVWRLADDSAAVTQALRQAVAVAKTKAEALAAAQGVKVGGLVMMSEASVEQPVSPIYGYAASGTAEKDVAQPPISPGTLDVTATIIVTYAIER